MNMVDGIRMKVTVTSIHTVAFTFPDYTTIWKAMDGELGAHMRAAFDRVSP